MSQSSPKDIPAWASAYSKKLDRYSDLFFADLDPRSTTHSGAQGGVIRDDADRSPRPVLRVTFVGVATILIDDGTTSIMIDGFFSRPSFAQVAFTLLSPDRKKIETALEKLGVSSLAAVVVTHSHYDHALDSPLVAKLTGAKLVGSESTANIARGYAKLGFDMKNMISVEPAQPLSFGDFTVTLFPAAHCPHAAAPGVITKPVKPPAYWSEYRVGECYSVLIEHRSRSILVHSSAGFIRGALRNVHADLIYLGIASLGIRGETYRREYWEQVVKQIGASRVVPIHWDHFFSPIDRPVSPLQIFDDFNRTMDFLKRHGDADGIDIKLQKIWQTVNPFEP